MKIKDLYRRGRSPEGTFGIEVEIEARNGVKGLEQTYRFANRNRLWDIVNEGSVRNGAEFIFSRPLLKVDKDNAVDELYAHLADCPIDWTSGRTSVHVHINVSNDSVLDVYKFTTAYAMLENIILNYVDDKRKGNLFCLAFSDAAYLPMKLKEDIAEGHDLSFTADSQRLKYAALNLSAVYKYGSLEVRSLHGHATSSQVKEWSDALEYLHQRSKTYANPQAIVDHYYSSHPLMFVNSLLPGSFLDKILQPGWEETLEDSLPIVSSFAYATDWKKWEAVHKSRYKNKGANMKPPRPGRTRRATPFGQARTAVYGVGGEGGVEVVIPRGRG